MPDLPELDEVRSAWRNQPCETPVDVERLQQRRTMELSATTRSEIWVSILAALLFAGVMALRFAHEGGRVVQLGCAGVVVWVVVTLIRFRASLRRAVVADAARTGLEHYRAELARRRDHLRSAWIWHGPMLLACVVAVAGLSRATVRMRIWEVLPVAVLLCAWAAIGMRSRFARAAELQREIDEIEGLRKEGEL